jgi:hypothetical protein
VQGTRLNEVATHAKKDTSHNRESQRTLPLSEFSRPGSVEHTTGCFRGDHSPTTPTMLRGNRSSLFFSHHSQSPNRLPYTNHTPPTPHHHGSPWFNELRSPRKNPPAPHSHGRWRAALRSSPLRSGVFFGAVIFASLIVYTTFLSPQGSLWHRPQDWHGLSHDESLILDLENTPRPTTLGPAGTVET